MAQARDAVEAVALASAVAEHAHDLRVLLARLLEFELAFGLFVLVLGLYILVFRSASASRVG